MKNRFILIIVVLLVGASVTAQNKALRFNKNGKFKIVQFTDIHFRYEDPRSDIALERINEVLKAEKPDFVVFTGDVVYSKPADSLMRKVLEQVSTRKIPFAVVFGNHDDEQGMSREELYSVVRSIPYCLNPEPVPGISGVSNFVLTVKASQGDKDAAILYGLDSQSYSKIKDVDGYACFGFDQILWYKEKSAYLTKQNGGTPLPSIAFFHIPLPEYAEATTSEDPAMYGAYREKVCSPKLNSGMFAAMKEAGDVMATFVGHDHDNDYAAYWKGILLCYGRYTGGDTEYNNLPNGARVIELSEGQRTFDTWIRQKDNQIENRVNYPSSFIKRKR